MMRSSGQGGRADLPEPQGRVLQRLAELGPLSTAQLQGFILSDLPPRTAYRQLEALRAAGLVRAWPLGRTPGRRQLCWSLCYGGAHAIGRAYPHEHQPYRASTLTPEALADKTVMLTLLRHLKLARWTGIRPAVYTPAHPKPAQSPQSRAVAVAIRYHFEHTPAREPQPGEPLPPPPLHPEQVPPDLNDWVAYDLLHPERCLVLILPPRAAPRRFWWAPPGGRRASMRRVAGRVPLYTAIAAILPVLAIFPTAELAGEDTALLRQAGLRPCTPDALPRLLRDYGAR